MAVCAKIYLWTRMRKSRRRRRRWGRKSKSKTIKAAYFIHVAVEEKGNEAAAS